MLWEPVIQEERNYDEEIVYSSHSYVLSSRKGCNLISESFFGLRKTLTIKRRKIHVS